MIALKTWFLIFIVFYIVVKLSFFVSVWFITGSIAKKALADKEKRQEAMRIRELESKLASYEQTSKKLADDKRIYGTRYKKYIP